MSQIQAFVEKAQAMLNAYSVICVPRSIAEEVQLAPKNTAEHFYIRTVMFEAVAESPEQAKELCWTHESMDGCSPDDWIILKVEKEGEGIGTTPEVTGVGFGPRACPKNIWDAIGRKGANPK